MPSQRIDRGVATLCILLLVGCSSEENPGVSSKPAWFIDQAGSRGLDFVHQSSGKTEMLMFPDIVGSGAALTDVDGDGDLDAYLVQSGILPGTADTGATPPANRLYINEQGKFRPSPDPGAASDTGYGMGVTAGDYDNDGDNDLYVTNLGRNVLLVNDGNGHFSDYSDYAGVAHEGFGTAAAFIDLDADGDLDLFLVNYVDWHITQEKDCYLGGVRTYCLPTNYASPGMDVLYRNNGNGTFTDVTADSGIDLAYGRHGSNFRGSRPGLGIVPADFNGDGLLDVFVANDLMVDQLWINQGGMRFEDRATLWGCDLDEHGIAKAGMGVSAADVDNDLDVDLLVVNAMEQTDSFYRNEGSYFTDITSIVGLGASSRRNTRFGVTLSDFNNDGQMDLYHANGAITIFETKSEVDPYAETNVLYRGTSTGRFEEVMPPGGVSPALVHTSRGMAYGDIDDDGGIDLLVINRNSAPYLLMNQASKQGNWIRFSVLTQDGRDALGASLIITTPDGPRRRDVLTAGSYLASNDPRVHLGLGDTTDVQEVRVRWVTGAAESFGPFKAGKTHILNQGQGNAL